MTSRTVPSAIVVLFASVALLAGCAAPADSGANQPDATPSEPPQTTDVSDVCAALEGLGVDGTTVGPLDITAPKEDLAEQIDAQLGALDAVEAPEEYAEQWGAQLTYLNEMRVVVEGLPAGGDLSASDFPSDPAAWEFWTDFWFGACG
jgi:hypothetical protein